MHGGLKAGRILMLGLPDVKEISARLILRDARRMVTNA